jgi:hypothetical protein
VREATYEIRVRGRVSGAALERLEGMQGRPGAVQTVLHGTVRDQAELHGLLARIKAHGLELVEVRRLPPQLSPRMGDHQSPRGRAASEHGPAPG